MLKFVDERQCRDLCQDLRIERPHTSSAMSLGNLKTRILKRKKQMASNGVMLSRYGAPFDLRFLGRSRYYLPPFASDPKSNPHRHLDTRCLAELYSIEPLPVRLQQCICYKFLTAQT